MTIGAKIRELREEKGISVEQLGNMCDISRQRMAAIESGKGYPLIPTLMKVSKAIGCSLFDLLNEPLELSAPSKKMSAEKQQKPTDSSCANAEKCMFFKPCKKKV